MNAICPTMGLPRRPRHRHVAACTEEKCLGDLGREKTICPSPFSGQKLVHVDVRAAPPFYQLPSGELSGYAVRLVRYISEALLAADPTLTFKTGSAFQQANGSFSPGTFREVTDHGKLNNSEEEENALCRFS